MTMNKRYSSCRVVRRAVGRISTAWVSFGVVLGIARGAKAEPAHRIALGWRQTEGCIDAATLARIVERVLGRPVFRSDARAAAIIDGGVGPDGSGFRATIELS